MLEDQLGSILFEKSPMRMAIVSVPDYRYEMANPAQTSFYESMGVTDFIGRRCVDMLKTEHAAKLLTLLDEVCRSGEPRTAVDTPAEVTVDGRAQKVYTTFRYSPIVGPSGSVEHVMWTGADTTDKVLARKSEAEARSRAERDRDMLSRELSMMNHLHGVVTKFIGRSDLKDLLETILDASIGIARSDYGNIQLFDPETKTLRLSVQRGFNKPFLDYFAEVRGDEASCGKAMSTGRQTVVPDVTTSPVFVGTRELPVMLEADVRACESTPIFGRRGNLLGMLSTHHKRPFQLDEIALKYLEMLASQAGRIIERHTLEQALADARLEAEQRAAEWEALIQASPDAIYVTDDRGEILEANPAWYEYTGYDRGAPLPGTFGPMGLIMTTPDGKPVPVEDRPTFRALRGEKVANYRYRLVNVKGQEFELLHNVTAIDTPRGKRALSIVTDITELRRLEQLKDEFMLVVSHELRNPLQVVLGQAQLLALKMTPELDPIMGSGVKSLMTQTRLLASLVDGLLSGYRVGNGRLSVNMTRTDFRAIVLEALETQAADTDHEWSTALPEPRVDVIADPERLGQAITNLLTNARKYTPTRGHIWVNLSSSKGAALLSVEDDGQGIPPGDLERVFGGFYRVPDVAKWQSGSIGLGLYISRSLIRRMGGDLWAEHRSGGGTVMFLKMPLASHQTPA